MLSAVSLVFGMLTVWAAIGVLLVALFAYRYTIGKQEEDQLYLDPGEAHLVREQREVIRKLERLSPYLWGMFVAWLVVGLATFAVWVWQSLR